MIEIVYDKKSHSVAVKGHAGYAPKGQDIVCAAVSAITYTLAADVKRITGIRRMARRPVIVLEEGSSTVSCDAVHGSDAIVEMIYDSVCVGYELIARQYPEYVRYTAK